MDDLLATMTGVSVTKHVNNPHAEHPRFALYKAKNTGSSQEERRKRVLQARKEARYDLLNHLRSIEEQGDTTLGSSSSDDSMDCEEGRAVYKKPRLYKNFVMLSEWLVDVPQDFATSYVALPCPIGKRSLIVSGNGRTRAYAKSGMMVNQFPSLLPGGNRHQGPRGYSMLDCIWSEANRTYYILDLVFWNNQSVLECETDFRFEWLKSKMSEEIPEATKTARLNPYRFHRIPYFDCSNESLSRLVNEPLPFDVPLDGVLFYHRETHYTHGPTPLVGWLKAYMFPEIIGVPVAETYLAEKPAKYVNLPGYIKACKTIGKSQRLQNKSKRNKMEISDASETASTAMDSSSKENTSPSEVEMKS